MVNFILNVIAITAPYNTGGLTLIGYFVYLLYYSVFVIRVVINASRGKTFNVVNQLLGFAAVFALVLVLYFVDPSNTHKTIKDVIVLFLIWLGSVVFIRVALARLQQRALHK